MKQAHHFKEPFCTLSHGAGVLLSVIGLGFLLVLANGEPWRVAALAIYGTTLVLLYAASTLYHALHAPPRVESWLARFDYSAIYLLIAGSYTPVCVVKMGGAWGWGLLIAVWSLAVVGVTSTLVWEKKPAWLRITLYLVMGWLVVIAIGPLCASLPAAAIGWIVAGGLLYSVGTVVLCADKPHLWPGRFSAHDLWHLFVLGGSACHFVVAACWVAPL